MRFPATSATSTFVNVGLLMQTKGHSRYFPAQVKLGLAYVFAGIEETDHVRHIFGVPELVTTLLW